VEFIFCGFGVLLFGVFLGGNEDGMSGGWGVVRWGEWGMGV